jgi:hypothetical protein
VRARPEIKNIAALRQTQRRTPLIIRVDRCYEFADTYSGDPSVSKNWNKAVTLALEAPDTFTTISNLQQATWALIEDWPLEDGEALDRALLVIEAAIKGKTSAEDARLAFIAAAREAKIEIKE